MPRPKHTLIRERVARRIRQARLGRRWTQERLAEALGVSVESVSRYEGGRLAVSLEILDRIAAALSVPIEVLVREGPPGLAPEEAELVAYWRALDVEGQRRVLLLLQWASEGASHSV